MFEKNIQDINSSAFMTPAFLYGESIFTTVKLISGEIKDWEAHKKRLLDNAMSYFDIASLEKLSNGIELDLKKQALGFTGALRVTIFSKVRENLLQTKFSEIDLDFKITKRALSKFDKEPVRLKLVKRVQCKELDEFKIGAYGKELYLKRKYLAQGFDDILFFGEGKIFETSVSNIFFRKGKQIFTPASGIYKGLTREKLIRDKKVIEREILVDELDNFDEIFTASSLFEKVVVESIER